MKTLPTFIMVASAFWMCAVHAGAPLPLDKVASADDLAAEAVAKSAEMEPWLADADAYKEHADKLRNAVSLLAVLGQALAEHPQDSTLKAAGPAVRDAAIALGRSRSYEEAKAAWPNLQSAAQGHAVGDHAKDYDWAKLARMHPAMEEMNQRAAQLRRLLRRPKDPAADSRHAMSIAILAVATHADVHEVKNPTDVPQWRELASALQEHMSASAQAIRAKDTAKGNQEFLAGMETCTKCHDAFKKK